jgi:hypothetical protein
MGTAAQESRLTYLKQLGGGPALGLFQMEPATHNDIWVNFLKWKPSWQNAVLEMTTTRQGNWMPRPEEMIWNLQYAAAMCRIHYVRKPGAIPITVTDQAMYWKKHFNTELGKGTEREFIDNYALVAR